MQPPLLPFQGYKLGKQPDMTLKGLYFGLDK